jgi:hypothetical protein
VTSLNSAAVLPLQDEMLYPRLAKNFIKQEHDPEKGYRTFGKDDAPIKI